MKYTPEEAVDILIEHCPGVRDLEESRAWEYFVDRSEEGVHRFVYLGGYQLYRAQIVCSNVESADFNIWSSMVRCGETLIHNEPSPSPEEAAEKVKIITDPINAVDGPLQEAQKRTAGMSKAFIDKIKRDVEEGE